LNKPLFRIELKSRGIVFECSADQTLLQAAIAANVLLPHGCKAGQCGRCKSKCTGGKYHYTDGPFDAINADETGQGLLLCCQARPTSDMSLESYQP